MGVLGRGDAEEGGCFVGLGCLGGERGVERGEVVGEVCMHVSLYKYVRYTVPFTLMQSIRRPKDIQ